MKRSIVQNIDIKYSFESDEHVKKNLRNFSNIVCLLFEKMKIKLIFDSLFLEVSQDYF